MKGNMAREVTIRPVLNGFVCQVGCQLVVFNDTKSLGRAVEEYFDNPEQTEKRYLEKAVNKIAVCPPPTASEPCRDDQVRQQAPAPPQMEGRLRDPR